MGHLLLVLGEKLEGKGLPYRVDIADVIPIRRIGRDEGHGNTKGRKG